MTRITFSGTFRTRNVNFHKNTKYFKIQKKFTTSRKNDISCHEKDIESRKNGIISHEYALLSRENVLVHVYLAHEIIIS